MEGYFLEEVGETDWGHSFLPAHKDMYYKKQSCCNSVTRKNSLDFNLLIAVLYPLFCIQPHPFSCMLYLDHSLSEVIVSCTSSHFA